MKMSKLATPSGTVFESTDLFERTDLFGHAEFSAARREAPASGRAPSEPLWPMQMQVAMRRQPKVASRSFGVLMALGVHLGLALAWYLSGSLITALKTPEPVVLVDVMRPEKIDTPEPAKKIAPPNLSLPLPRLQVPVPEVVITEAVTTTPRAVMTPETAPPPPQAADTTAIVETFQIKLLKHLNRYKRYPASAKSKREQGVAFVHFTMDREGRVLSARLEKSSGFVALDAEGVALLNRAQPLPKPPAELDGNPLAMIVPVEFFVR